MLPIELAPSFAKKIAAETLEAAEDEGLRVKQQEVLRELLMVGKSKKSTLPFFNTITQFHSGNGEMVEDAQFQVHHLPAALHQQLLHGRKLQVRFLTRIGIFN